MPARRGRRKEIRAARLTEAQVCTLLRLSEWEVARLPLPRSLEGGQVPASALQALVEAGRGDFGPGMKTG